MSEPEQQQHDILVRLEATVAEWNAQVSQAQQALTDCLARAKTRLATPENDPSAGPAASEPPATYTGEFEAIENASREMGARVKSLEAELQRLHRNLEEHYNAQQEAEKRAARLERTVQSLREHIVLLESELAEAREHRTRDAVDGGFGEGQDAALPDQLSRAFRDRDEAHQEIIALRGEIDELRRKSAITVGAQPASGVPETIVRASFDRDGQKRRIGDILVTAGLVTQEQLDDALSEQETTRHRRLGEILVSRGHTAEELIAQVLASQVRAPFVDLKEATVVRAATRLISERLATHHMCIPIDATPEELTLVMSNPLDLIAIEDIELATGLRVIPVVATATDITEAIGRYYY